MRTVLAPTAFIDLDLKNTVFIKKDTLLIYLVPVVGYVVDTVFIAVVSNVAAKKRGATTDFRLDFV